MTDELDLRDEIANDFASDLNEVILAANEEFLELDPEEIKPDSKENIALELCRAHDEILKLLDPKLKPMLIANFVKLIAPNHVQVPQDEFSSLAVNDRQMVPAFQQTVVNARNDSQNPATLENEAEEIVTIPITKKRQ